MSLACVRRVCISWVSTWAVEQVVHICTACLERVRIEVDSPPDVRLRSMESLALVLQAGAKPQPRQIAQLIVLDDEYLGDLRACILSAVCSARNPFIPGTSLLVTLDAAARISPDEEQRVLQGLGDDVSRLLLEILEQLPKAVDAIPGTMATCSSLFESNAMETQPTGFTGPLGVALMHQKTMEILCTRPLVLDFMSHRFNGSLHQGGRNQDLSMEERILIEFHKNYKVPKWRMGLDVLVYLIVLVYFSKIVLLHDGPMRLPEQLSIVYVMVRGEGETERLACGDGRRRRASVCDGAMAAYKHPVTWIRVQTARVRHGGVVRGVRVQPPIGCHTRA